MTKTKIKMASCADFPAPLEKLFTIYHCIQLTI